MTFALELVPEGLLPDWLQIAIAIVLIAVLVVGVVVTTVRIRRAIADSGLFR